MTGVETDAVRVQFADELTETKRERDGWRHAALEAQQVAHAALSALRAHEAAGLASWPRSRGVLDPRKARP